MANYAENIFQAIDVIVGARLSEISYDTTVKATIINADKAGKGEYIVDDGSSRYKAYSETTTYEVEDEVYVSIPNGDYTQQKIITGKCKVMLILVIILLAIHTMNQSSI